MAESTTPTVHELKTHPEPFAALRARTKQFEVRRDDRGFQVGDVLRLREWDVVRLPGIHVDPRYEFGYTRREETRTVGYIQRGFGLPDDMCVLGFEELIAPAGGAGVTNCVPASDEVLALLAEFVDDEPCEYDHHGLCQTHSLSERPCMVTRARALLGTALPEADVEPCRECDGSGRTEEDEHDCPECEFTHTPICPSCRGTGVDTPEARADA